MAVAPASSKPAPVDGSDSKEQATYLLVAIDGTLSEDYHAGGNISSVRGFFDSFGDRNSTRKFYHRGPGVSGGDLRSIPQVRFNLTDDVVRLYATGACSFGAVSRLACRGVGEIAVKAHDAVRSMLDSEPSARIVIVGHSRGGLIATNLAAKLGDSGRKVWFLGLYDAVDMALFMDAPLIPDNVEHAAHAKRDPRLFSRAGWKNCSGVAGHNSERHFEKRFFGTHSAIGGAAGKGCRQVNDLLRIQKDGETIFRIRRDSGTSGSDHCAVELSAGQNEVARRQADDFVRSHARRVGVPV